MSGSWKYFFMVVLAVFVGYIALKFVLGIVTGLIGAIFSLAVPVLIVGGIAYILYSIINRKSLLGGSRRTLP